MAHFAHLDSNNVVTKVIVVSNDDAPTEEVGQAFIANVLKLDGVWKQTSYNTKYVFEYEYDNSEPPKLITMNCIGSIHTNGGTPFRGTYAGIGYTYDAVNDVFVAPPVEEDATE